MKHKVLSLSLFTMIIILISACSEEIIEANTNNDNYMPLIVGDFITYKLDSFIYNDFTQTDTQKTFLVRELVESTFEDASGNEVYRIERAYKVNESDSWGSAGYDIWFANHNGNNAERIEENQRYVKLNYPLFDGKSWDGNIHINTNAINDNDIDSLVENPLEYLEDWEYVANNYEISEIINDLSFVSTVTINQQSFGIQTDTIGAHEIYAKDVGLIYKELWVLSTQCSSCDDNDIPCKIECFESSWLEKAESGFVVKMEITSYGSL